MLIQIKAFVEIIEQEVSNEISKQFKTEADAIVMCKFRLQVPILSTLFLPCKTCATSVMGTVST